MTPRESEISDHKEMLAIRRISIAREWKNRHQDKEIRSLVRWLVEQANFHKHMIVQLEELPDMTPADFWPL